MFVDNTTDSVFPKTLLVRNHEGGLVWQVYHVQKQSEAEHLSDIATGNGFEAISLVDHIPNLDETWPDWRDTCDAYITA